jgi:DNA-directed RNA polymerase subunit alpha
MNNLDKRHWSDLIRPVALEIDSAVVSETYGKYVAKPLERGFGLTLGNGLRRILLSSMRGAAVIAVKIEGAHHEFGTLANIREEVSEIILNLQAIIFNLEGKDEVVLNIESNSSGPLLASAINLSNGVDVLNPDQVICNIASGGSFKAEIKLCRGRGYVSAADNKETHSLGMSWIYLDTLFSPIKRVNYTVANTRVGKRTDYDKLTIEVWSDGTVNPTDAVALSAKVLRDQLTVFLNFEDEDAPSEVSKSPMSKVTSINEFLLKPVSELELSVRSANCLQNANIKYIYELVSKTEGEMLRTKNFGRKSLNEIKEILTIMGLGLGMKIDSALKNQGSSVK